MTILGPLTDPAAWTSTLPGLLTLPAGTLHAGTVARVLRSTATAPAEVRLPLGGVLRLAALDATTTVVELTVNPIPVRATMTRLPGGLPTLYLALPSADVTAAAGHATAGTALASTQELRLTAAHQDRICRDPTRWVDDVLVALTAAGADTTGWAPFAAHVAALAAGADAPVLLLDHSGRPAGSTAPAAVDVVLPGGTHRLNLEPADGGDLQKAMARAASSPGGPPRPDLLSGPATLRPVAAPGTAVQVAAETGESAPGELGVTRARRAFSATDLHAWFAAQRAMPTGGTAPALARFSRGNHLTPYTRGRDYFHDLMRAAAAAAAAAGDPVSEFHLAGWSIDHKLEIAVPGPDDPAGLPTTLLAAATAITGAGGRTRFLAPRSFQPEPAPPAGQQEQWAVFIVVGGLLVLGSFADGALSGLDGSGAVIISVLLLANPALSGWLFGQLERFVGNNVPAVTDLGALSGSSAVLTGYPARLEDNIVAPSAAGFPFDALFRSVRKFGIHHTKLAVVRWSDGTDRHDVAYCGGIDVWPNRLDDERHLSDEPFHDVHARLDGPAVRDLAVTFAQYQAHEVPTDPVPDLPAADTFRADGPMAVQVARTYFAAVPGSGRAFPFAPQGDRTLADTLLAAICNAREFIYVEDQYYTPPPAYQAALLAKVASRDLRALVVVVPALADQPFGQTVRDPFVQALFDAAAPGCSIRVGYPRLGHRLADNRTRAAAGRCRLVAGISATDDLVHVGPLERLPAPPFWLGVEGELMYVVDEDTIPATGGGRWLRVLRGDATGFFRGTGPPAGAARGGRPRAHRRDAAATVVSFPSVYVHAKMMIVDDVFLSVGSANINRRGLFHDGETNVFAVPQALRFDPANPVPALRARLWAEMLDLPHDLAAPLLADPLAALDLFDRSPFAGNRFAPLSAYPEQLMFGASTGDGVAGLLLQLGAAASVAANHRKLFDAAIDPSSATENQ